MVFSSEKFDVINSIMKETNKTSFKSRERSLKEECWRNICFQDKDWLIMARLFIGLATMLERKYIGLAAMGAQQKLVAGVD